MQEATQAVSGNSTRIAPLGRPIGCITSFEQDKLERSEFSRRIADRIRLAGTGQSVVFGLSGDWGAGKTSARDALLVGAT